MTWLLVIGAAWLALAAVLAYVIGRAIRLADTRHSLPPIWRLMELRADVVRDFAAGAGADEDTPSRRAAS